MTVEDAMKRVGAVMAEDATNGIDTVIVEDSMKRMEAITAEVVAQVAAGENVEGRNIAKVSEVVEISEIITGEKAGTAEKAGIGKTGMEKIETEKAVASETENIAEAETMEEMQAAKEPESEAAKPESAPTFVIKKTTIKKALFCTTGFVAAIILLVCCLGNAEIRDVKNGMLEDYNYGVSIGDALHKWFGGTEKWSSFSEDGVVYVMARGMTKYTATKKSQEQIFLFHHNDEYFVFDGAFDTGGDYLYMGNGDVDLFDLGDMIVLGLYEQTLKAAFGDKEALKRFMEQE